MVARMCAVAAVVVMIAGGAHRAAGQTPALFDFQSAFWVNLHHYLHALARSGSPLKEDLPATATSAERETWQAAIDSYRRQYGGLSLLFDASMRALKMQIVAAASKESLSGSAVPSESSAVLERAAPVYRRHVWPAHDTANQRFVASMQPLLARHGAAIATRLARSYDTVWPARPVRADVVHAVQPPGGGYTTNDPTHITIEATDPRQAGLAGLEVLFHEASHGWDETLIRELDQAAAVLKTGGVPNNLWHAVLFYNAGEITRRVLAEAGLSDYRMYMEVQNVFPRAREIIAVHWPAFLDGRITRQEALLRILRAAAQVPK